MDEVGFFIFGIAFFIFVMHYVTSDSNQTHQNRVNEHREFGHPIEDPPPRSRKRR